MKVSQELYKDLLGNTSDFKSFGTVIYNHIIITYPFSYEEIKYIFIFVSSFFAPSFLRSKLGQKKISFLSKITTSTLQDHNKKGYF